MKQVKFEATGKDITNIKVGDIVNYETWSKDSTNKDNPLYNTWEKMSDILGDSKKDWEVIKINKINDKYIKIKIQRCEPVKTGSKTFYFPKHVFVFNMNGISKSIYSSSSSGYSWKVVITNIKYQL